MFTLKNRASKVALSLLASITCLLSCSRTIQTEDPNTVNASNIQLPFDFNNPFGFPAKQDVTDPNAPTPPMAQDQFMWGVSSAGYQCEGNDNSSSWYFWDISGKTEDRNLNSVDFYNRYKEDIKLAKDMGVNAFRLSIEWSRIEPRKGVFDPAGIAFYHNVINEIKAQGMVPMVTLIHFNYPQWILDDLQGSRKGLDNPDFINYFLRYTDLVVREFGNDVKYWVTFNEPNIWVPGGHILGQMPPGKKNPLSVVRATWNLLKAHSKAYDLIHYLDNDAMVSSNMFYLLPKPFGSPTQPPADGQDPDAKILTESNIMDTDWFYEGLNTGKVAVNKKIFVDVVSASQKVPDDVKTLESELKSEVNVIPSNPSIKLDSGVSWLKKFDYVAFDYYYRFRNVNQVINLKKPWLMELYPKGLYDAIMYYHKKYGKPIVIAENGIATEDLEPRKDGWTREAAIVEHVKYMKQAMSEGANVLGYFHWSITDNYEWGTFKPRFGLYSINALKDPSYQRIKTPAVDVYAEVIKNNGVTRTLLGAYRAPSASK